MNSLPSTGINSSDLIVAGVNGEGVGEAKNVRKVEEESPNPPSFHPRSPRLPVSSVLRLLRWLNLIE